ncbi:PhzF family phenazine biosynthesis protein [Fulvivirga sp. M361]|uniref:PhzF family phenazine biosynthesis protein n=1 Tax=Fulvivirga sp. M361 TaxID=2594266 RepID=UPI00117BB1D9|nr:PhzF family phenazine biosynthesis protein [Fulvivirga sp. M361]TRX57570.1 PhzF family phenazine biosynthesis protein [Fulvivirga sp. M361]
MAIDKLPLYQVDAFASTLFSGNPAAVCPLRSWIEDDVMQKIAAENNLAETAFFVPVKDHYELRWFTPLVEVDLCGHATLASAHVLYHHLGYEADEIVFQTKNAGPLKVFRQGDQLTLDFPCDELQKVTVPEGLSEALGTTLTACYKGKTDYLVVVKDQETLDQLSPDFRALAQFKVRGVIATCRSKKYDFVSRFFAPAAGVDEDPVTGSAHTSLVPYWANELNKNILNAQQRSKRGGELHCSLKSGRVFISGKATTYLVGEINIC